MAAAKKNKIYDPVTEKFYKRGQINTINETCDDLTQVLVEQQSNIINEMPDNNGPDSSKTGDKKE
ncbi:MAG TPA: hypothetical protein PK926_16130 [Spirochaetota bacterium]|nr:hypothetical protein [Spirochaetota bacterium]HPI90523.1 hypothetical protein [Spirochaetota bacterium]HPR47877.1 hypothetical protein [Spirochaetota bacterium]